MQTLVMSEDTLLVLQLITMISMFTVEQKLEISSKSTLKKPSIKELAQLKGCLAWVSQSLEYCPMEI